MQNIDLIRSIRLAELDVAMQFFPAHAHVLELGAGAGWQAQAMTRRGFEVVALETDANHYPGHSAFPLLEYDGYSIPGDDLNFDVVFSSNVLEHVADLQRLLRETHRVLKDDGVAVHILPNATWRLWVNAAHPIWIIQRSLQLTLGRAERVEGPCKDRAGHNSRRNWLVDFAANILPSRHGERGNAWTEAYYFSTIFWRRVFRESGFELIRSQSAGVFYVSATILGTLLPIPVRRAMTGFLGSSCTIFVLKKAGEQ